jgi:hypothetical protein
MRTIATFVALTATYLSAAAPPSDEQDRTAIERLHEQDIAATLTDDADQLAKLRDQDAVRFQSGSPAEIGKATITPMTNGGRRISMVAARYPTSLS